ncbi:MULTISPECIES: CoA transferase [unclassified Streptomyces]|uniref:CoA transferase n=1 Tax=unclassified Streptomyces TaxID=2593676 RepID=UPI000BFC5F44|nr:MULTISPECIES: CoA transferase [unclassified Streptomyces]PVC95202.1 hypothetical protein DBP21_29130 [Streptomyces sp. CS147]
MDAQEARNKKSGTLDLRTGKGQRIVRDLTPHFDVVVTNYRPPTLRSWGLDPDRLSELAPDTVLVNGWCRPGREVGYRGTWRSRTGG